MLLDFSLGPMRFSVTKAPRTLVIRTREVSLNGIFISRGDINRIRTNQPLRRGVSASVEGLVPTYTKRPGGSSLHEYRLSGLNDDQQYIVYSAVPRARQKYMQKTFNVRVSLIHKWVYVELEGVRMTIDHPDYDPNCLDPTPLETGEPVPAAPTAWERLNDDA